MSFATKISNKFRQRKENNIYQDEYKTVRNFTKDIVEQVSSASDNQLQTLFSESIKKTNFADTIYVADEALYRVKGIRFFDTQKVAASLLSKGKLIEMATGEGKTLAFALAAAIISKTQKVTVSTANDFLSHRDWASNKSFFDMLGISSGSVIGSSDREHRKTAYSCEITYSTLREVSYDYLRDGKSLSSDDLFLPISDFLLIDEADNVLVDNAASPYVLSDETETNKSLIAAAHDFAIQSEANKTGEQNYIVSDENEINLSEIGLEKLEGFLTKYNFMAENESLYTRENMQIVHIFENAGRAIHVMAEGVDYVVDENEIVVIDKTSGRKLPSVVLSNGIQQILEYRHGLQITNEAVATATIVTEAVVTMFKDFSGMSGTLKVEEDELISVYHKPCISIPRKDVLSRVDRDDVMFISKTEKVRYVLKRVLEAYKEGQPVMVAATTEGEAQGLSNALDEMKLDHQLITSKTPTEEASMIAMAGTPYKVTVTTGACGRGTDIILGGNLEHFIENKLIEQDKIEEAKIQQSEARAKALKAGGLLVIGFGRQATRKLDLQLRGRSGRQGDIGESIFALSLDDKILGEHGAKLRNMLIKMNVNEKDMLSHSMITKAFDNAQRSIREQILKTRKFYSQQASTIEQQRAILYRIRLSILTNKNWKKDIQEDHGIRFSNNLQQADAILIFDEEYESYKDVMNDLRKSIGYQSYANKNPAQELKKKAFDEYKRLLFSINERFEEFKAA